MIGPNFVNRRALISFEVNFGLKKKTKQFSFLYENVRIRCHLLISTLNGDGFIANETRIQTAGTIVYLHVGLHIVSDALAGKAD